MNGVEVGTAFLVGFALGVYACFGVVVRTLVRKAKKDPRLKTVMAALIEEVDK